MFSEQQLIEMLKARDQNGLSELYDRYSSALFGVALRIVGKEAEAEDVLQDAFIKIWKYAKGYDAKRGTLFTWMLNITRNTAIDRTRSAHFSRRGKIQSMDNFVNGSERGMSEEMPVDQIGLRGEVKKLEVKYQTIINLIYFNGYTQQEVADELGMPLGTVKSRVKIALRELRKVYVEVKRMVPFIAIFIKSLF